MSDCPREVGILSYGTSDATEWTRVRCRRRVWRVHARTAWHVADITPDRRACDTSATHVVVYFFDAAITRVSTAVLCIRSSAEHRAHAEQTSVTGMSPVPVQMWQGLSPGPGADVAGG